MKSIRSPAKAVLAVATSLGAAYRSTYQADGGDRGQPLQPSDMMAQMQAVMEIQRGKPKRKSITLKNILFIVSGAFDKPAESIKKRVSRNEMGFGADVSDAKEDISTYLQKAETSDFIKYGFEPEFIGRVPVRCACSGLSAKDLAHILTTSEGSILHQYRDDFRGYGINFSITPEAIMSIAETASKEGTGARGIMTVMERLFRDYKFEAALNRDQAL